MTRAWLALSAVVASTSATSPASGSEPEAPWTPPGTPELPAWAQSVEILREDEPLYRRADARATRRGTAAVGVRLPLFEASQGPGCEGRWLSVGPMAWVCEAVVRLSKLPAIGTEQRALPAQDGLPHRYYFVGERGTLGYRDLLTAEQGYPDAELEPDFVVGLLEIRERSLGDPFGLTTHRLWVPLGDLRPVQPSSFQGSRKLEQLGWIVGDTARARAKPAGRLLPERYQRLSQVRIQRTELVGKQRWFLLQDGHWLSEQDVTERNVGPLPSGIKPGERWIDVDLQAQVLTAFEGESPVFATLVSTGRGQGDAEDATPPGEHRIWVKLRTSDMDNLENPEASRYYAIQSVPWVMYFDRGYGLHGAFWHRDFGRVRSHGCVNLSPLDAYWLFEWVSPRLPAGWNAVFPTLYERGTLVRVR